MHAYNLLKLASCLFLLAIGCSQQVAKSDYSFVPYSQSASTKYRFFFGNFEVNGWIDNKGNIQYDLNSVFDLGKKNGEELAHNPGNTPFKFDFTPGQQVYEYRSGRLIPGVFDKDMDFVPDLDGKVIKIEEYYYSTTSRPIYNLPGQFVKK